MVLLMSIEGNIAAGKSTLVKNLSDKLSAELNYPFVLLQEQSQSLKICSRRSETSNPEICHVMCHLSAILLQA